MTRRIRYGILSAGLLAVAGLLGLWGRSLRDAEDPASVRTVPRPPRIQPDYSEAAIPPNIAPLNFLVEEPGTDYRVHIHAAHGEAIDVACRSGSVVIPQSRWEPPHRETRFEMVHFTRQREWNAVLRVARRMPRSYHDCFSRHLVNRALYHTGRLGDEQFSFSQDQAGLLLLTGDVPHGAPKFWMLSEIAWELGDVNCAEQWAFERLEAIGECPAALELLAQACLAKASPSGDSPGREAARVLLKRMKKNLLQGRRANELLALLDEASPDDDGWLRQIERVRGLRGTDDRVFQAYSEELMLESLLQAHPHNQMALEYLMAFYLVTRRPDKLVANLPRLDASGKRELPRHYEEAILIHAHDAPQRVALHGRQIRPETIQRFHRFLERVRSWQTQPHLARAAVADEFGDSYFYYYAFGSSGPGGSR